MREQQKTNDRSRSRAPGAPANSAKAQRTGEVTAMDVSIPSTFDASAGAASGAGAAASSHINLQLLEQACSTVMAQGQVRKELATRKELLGHREVLTLPLLCWSRRQSVPRSCHCWPSNRLSCQRTFNAPFQKLSRLSKLKYTPLWPG